MGALRMEKLLDSQNDHQPIGSHIVRQCERFIPPRQLHISPLHTSPILIHEATL